jgi:hypothetical protein
MLTDILIGVLMGPMAKLTAKSALLSATCVVWVTRDLPREKQALIWEELQIW